MSNYDDVLSADDAAEAISAAWHEDPAAVTTQLIQGAAADQFERLRPTIDSVVEGHRQRLYGANTAEAIAAMEATYGENWPPYKAAVNEYVERNPDVINAVADDPQKLAERLQSIYRTVKPQVDAERQTGEWDGIKGSYTTYADVMARAGR